MKSASSYQYQLITELLQCRHSSYSSYIKHREHLVGKEMSDLYFDPVDNEIEALSDMIPASDYFAFKTHNVYDNKGLEKTSGPVITAKLKDKLDKKEIVVIGSIRDPRSIVLSALDHSKRNIKNGVDDFFTTMDSIDALIPHIKQGYKKAKYWNLTSKATWIPYHQLFTSELEIIFLLKDITGLFSIDINEKIIELKKNNQIHQFNKGVVNRWEFELDTETKNKLSHTFSEEIAFYNKLSLASKKKIDQYTNYLIKTKGKAYYEQATKSLSNTWN